MPHEPEGVSTQSLLGAFFAVVVLCAVFFSLGFFLGYRQGHPASALAVGQGSALSDGAADGSPSDSSPVSASPESGSSPSGRSVSASQPAEPETTQDRPAEAQPAAVGQDATTNTTAEDSSSPQTAVSTEAVPRGVLVQVAALTNRQDAANVVSALKSRNYPALVLTPAQAKAKDSFYRVVAGPYKSRTDAEKARKELAAEGFKPFVR